MTAYVGVVLVPFLFCQSKIFLRSISVLGKVYTFWANSVV